ncbi:MAG: hypothetical protein P4L92_20520 [Rudaea sp.]|nr:hypothetical protein [Rudaea sp.]
MSAHSAMAQFDFEDSDRTWTLWIEALRPNDQWIRLLYQRHSDKSPASGKTVAKITDRERVYCFLEQVCDHDSGDPVELAAQILDMLVTLASEKPPEDAVAYLKWRTGEWIRDARGRGMGREDAAA